MRRCPREGGTWRGRAGSTPGRWGPGCGLREPCGWPVLLVPGWGGQRWHREGSLSAGVGQAALGAGTPAAAPHCAELCELRHQRSLLWVLGCTWGVLGCTWGVAQPPLEVENPSASRSLPLWGAGRRHVGDPHGPSLAGDRWGPRAEGAGPTGGLACDPGPRRPMLSSQRNSWRSWPRRRRRTRRRSRRR